MNGFSEMRIIYIFVNTKERILMSKECSTFSSKYGSYD